MTTPRKLLPAALFVAGAWAFLGVEEIPREHRTDYEFFTKQVPALQVIYRNPAVCGECDVEPFDTLGPDTKAALADFCRVRFGLDDVPACYAIFEARQRVAKTGLAPAGEAK